MKLLIWPALTAIVTAATATAAPTPLLLPKWKATYAMNESLMIQPSNISGYLEDPSIAQWAVVDIDWENARAQWAAALWQNHTSTCEAQMIEQVERLKAKRAAAKRKGMSWIYR